MVVDYKLIGRRVARYRRERQLTQERLAERLEVSTVYISHIENSRSIPSLETVMKLCQALEVTPDMLLLGSSRTQPDYQTDEFVQKFAACSPKERKLVNGFIDLLLSQRE